MTSLQPLVCSFWSLKPSVCEDEETDLCEEGLGDAVEPLDELQHVLLEVAVRAQLQHRVRRVPPLDQIHQQLLLPHTHTHTSLERRGTRAYRSIRSGPHLPRRIGGCAEVSVQDLLGLLELSTLDADDYELQKSHTNHQSVKQTESCCNL